MAGGHSTLGSRDGFVLPVAMVAFVIMSMLAMAGLYVARTELAASMAVRRSAKALYAGNAGAARTIANWDFATVSTLSPGDSMDLGWQRLRDGSTYRTVIRRVDDGSGSGVGLYKLRTAGRPSASSTALREVVTVVQASSGGDVCCQGAVLVQGRLDIRGRTAADPALPEVDGTDRIPTGWGGECLAPLADVPGVYTERLSRLRLQRFGDIAGDPPSTQDGSISDNTFSDFGGYTYDQLTGLATIGFSRDQTFRSDLGPRTSGTSCDLTPTTNWGDPSGPGTACWDHLPVVHVNGNLTITGAGSAQGILLVDGNLTIRGNFDFYGIVVVQGQVRHQGRGSEIVGGLMVRNRVGGGGTSRIQSGSRVQYSSCAVTRAMSSLSAVVPLPGRNWFETLE